MTNLYDSTKYYTTYENLSKTIELYGIAIIPSILDGTECKNMENEMWNYLEYITQKWVTPINRLDKTTWEMLDKLTKNSLLFECWNIGHCQMAWNVRQNPKIVNVFAKFWNVEPEELITSFDGTSFELLQKTKKSN